MPGSGGCCGAAWGGQRCGWCRRPGRSGRSIPAGAAAASSTARPAGRSSGSRCARRRGGGAGPGRACEPACPPRWHSTRRHALCWVSGAPSAGLRVWRRSRTAANSNPRLLVFTVTAGQSTEAIGLQESQTAQHAAPGTAGAKSAALPGGTVSWRADRSDRNSRLSQSDRLVPAPLQPGHPGLRLTAHQAEVDQTRDHPVPQALRPEGGLPHPGTGRPGRRGFRFKPPSYAPSSTDRAGRCCSTTSATGHCDLSLPRSDLPGRMSTIDGQVRGVPVAMERIWSRCLCVDVTSLDDSARRRDDLRRIAERSELVESCRPQGGGDGARRPSWPTAPR